VTKRNPWVVLWALAPALFLSACGEEPEEREIIRPIRAIRVESAANLINQWYPGTARATQETDLSFEVAGRLIQRPVFVGDRVESGTILAKLDPRDFENDVAFAGAERDRAKAHFERIEKAAATGAVAQQELTDAEARLNMASAQYRISAKALEDSVIIAPFDGTVSRTFRENFDNVREKEPVIRLVDTSRVEFVVNLPESVLPFIDDAVNIRVRFDTFPDVEIPAQIKEVATEPSQTTRTFAIALIMDQPDNVTIVPGMAGRATADASEELREDRLIVPVTALLSPKAGDATYVWVIDESTGVVSRRQVETGPLADTGQQIMGGLEAGEIIATAGVHFLVEGQRVRILDEQVAQQ